MYSKILGAFLAVGLLAACSSSEKDTASRTTAGSGALASRDPLSGGGDKIFFDFDRAVIRDDARATLDGQADWLNKNKTVSVQIAGDCDERGTEEYNIALGSRRTAYRSAPMSLCGWPASGWRTEPIRMWVCTRESTLISPELWSMVV